MMTLLLYLGPVSMGTVPRPTPTPTVTDTCCTVCTQGGPCCCLANGAVSCNLTYIAGLILRPAPCSRPTTPAIPAAGGTADHVMPAMVRGTDPLARELPVRTWTGTASSIALGPPDKIPIV